MADNEKYTLADILAAIRGSAGIKATIMRKLGCSRNTVDNYLRRYATAQQAYDEEIESIGDAAESVIIGAYNVTLAESFSRKSRRIAERYLSLDNERKAADEWMTTAGGVVCLY